MAAALLPGLLGLAWFGWDSAFERDGSRWFLLLDDAMISMTYARTLAETGELVWFPGADRVQGYTNPLWTLFMTALHAAGLGGSDASLVVIVTGVVLVLACAVLAGRLTGVVLDRRWRGWCAALVAGGVPLLYPLAFWTVRGMEVGLVALLLLVMLLSAARLLSSEPGVPPRGRPLVWLGAAAALGAATRLDFLLLAGVVLGLLWLWAPSRSRVVLAALPMLVTTALVLGFQRLYYGDWLPNTYHLKMDGVPVWDRVLHGAWTLAKSGPWLLLGGIGLIAIWRYVGERRLRRVAIVLAATVLASVGYHVWVGGDSWETNSMTNRFLAAALPVVLVLVVWGLSAWLSAAAPGPGWAVPGALVALTASAAGLGFVPSPDEFVPAMGAVGAGVAALVAPLAWLASSSLRRDPGSVPAARTLLAVGVLVMLTVTSAVPFALHVAQAPSASRGDAESASTGLTLSGITAADARIAVWPAGAVVYYSRRPAVDVLGKSDRRIARTPARLSIDGVYTGIVTGHDKWDLAYSIGELAPDVAYGVWDVASVREEVRGYGYRPWCTADGAAFYVRVGTTKVDYDAIRPCDSDDVSRPPVVR